MTPAVAADPRWPPWIGWIVALYVAAVTAWYAVAAVNGLRRPLNAGAEREWLAAFLVLAVVGALSTVLLGRVARLVCAAGMIVVGAAMIVLSGQLAAASTTVWLLALAAAWGSVVLDRTGAEARGLERVAVAVPLGLGIVALVALLVGVARLLRPWPIAVVLALLTAVRWRELLADVCGLARGGRRLLEPDETTAVPEAAVPACGRPRSSPRPRSCCGWPRRPTETWRPRCSCSPRSSAPGRRAGRNGCSPVAPCSAPRSARSSRPWWSSPRTCCATPASTPSRPTDRSTAGASTASPSSEAPRPARIREPSGSGQARTTS